MIKKILMALDKSGNEQKITACTINLAKALGGEVIAIHVIKRSAVEPAVDAYGNYMAGNIEALEQALNSEAEELLRGAELLGKEEGVKVEKEIMVMSSPSGAIIDYAKIKNIDLIVVGTKGITGLKQSLLGSVARNVICNAHCPVLAVK